MSDWWHGVEAVYCITLDTAVDRHDTVKKSLEKVGLWDKTTMLYSQRDPQGGVRGCFESHRLAWDKALHEGLDNVLIVEDDVFFAKDWRKYVPHMFKFMRENQDWDMLFLGWTPYKSFITPWKHVTRMTCGTATHAYILSRRGMKKGLPPYDDVRRAVDVHMMCPQCKEGTWTDPFASCSHDASTNQYQNYALKPMIAFQKYDETSSTGNTKWANKRKARVGLMRFFGNSSTTIAMPTLVLVLGLATLCAITTIITCCALLCKPKTS